MQGTTDTRPTAPPPRPLTCPDGGQRAPFSQEWVAITKEEHIELRHRASYWEAQHARARSRIEALEQEIVLKDAKIKDLENRLPATR